MTTRRTLLGVTAAAPLAALGLAACTGDGAAAGSATLRVGELGAAPVTQELFKAAGLDRDLPYAIEWKQFVNAGPEYIEAAGADAVDVGFTADTPLIFAASNGVGLKAIAVATVTDPEASGNAILAGPGTGIASVEDLQGRKVSFQEGTITQYHVVKALESVGLTLEDIEPVNLPVVDANTALTNGEVDAVATLGIYWTQAEAAGAELIATGAGFIPGNSLLSARTAVIDDEAYTDALTDFVDRYARAQQWRYDNVGEWSEIYAGLTGLDTGLIETTENRAPVTLGPVTEEVIAEQQDQVDVYTALGIIGELDAADQFDDAFSGAFEA
ncbi:ABC transporter substrate-binding protein [Glycomyces harbinensis]|uniref:Sulfonate transport system substrate-binding protein n=1 Tax=Glycomyces harbinensis TaxID=58114 RepID=A0A1G6RVA3_9ACTN|nr:ABC transporter substrate-binding protein [Glycomyces harbinensis]SDD08363.1 sulfonate transport system substrate-binding protein [Glycomyces harbinensis]